MDVNTGKILAMASLGNYDLNDFLAVSEKDREYIDEAETKEEAAGAACRSSGEAVAQQGAVRHLRTGLDLQDNHARDGTRRGRSEFK